MTDVRTGRFVKTLKEKVKGVTPLRLSVPDKHLPKGLGLPEAVTSQLLLLFSLHETGGDVSES